MESDNTWLGWTDDFTLDDWNNPFDDDLDDTEDLSSGCPTCGSYKVECLSPSYGVYVCRSCNARFDEDDSSAEDEPAAARRRMNHRLED